MGEIKEDADPGIAGLSPHAEEQVKFFQLEKVGTYNDRAFFSDDHVTWSVEIEDLNRACAEFAAAGNDLAEVDEEEMAYLYGDWCQRQDSGKEDFSIFKGQD
jgi:hypothetical protein